MYAVLTEGMNDEQRREFDAEAGLVDTTELVADLPEELQGLPIPAFYLNAE